MASAPGEQSGAATPGTGATLVANAMAALLPVHTAITPAWLADGAATAAERVLNASHAFLYTTTGDQFELCRPASESRRRALQKALDGFGTTVLRPRIEVAKARAWSGAMASGRALIGSAAEILQGLDEPEFADGSQKALGLHSLALAPLDSAGERLGVLLLTFVEAPDAEQVGIFAQHVACALVNLAHERAASERSVTDVIRSVFDARKFEAELQKELSRAVRYSHRASLCVIEATNMALLRETYGRFLADQLLQRMGAVLAENARDFDFLGAYRDSGYAMVLAEADEDGAAIASRRLLDMALATRLDAETVPGLELHLVAGWATCPGDGTTTEQLTAAAAARMYDVGEQVA